IVDKIMGGGTPLTSKSDYWTDNKDDGLLWVAIADITKSEYIENTKKYITEEGLNNSSAQRVEAYSVLYSIYASLVKVAYSQYELTTNQAILAIKPSEELLYKFLFYYLQTVEDKLPFLSSSTTQNNINLDVVKNFDITLPPYNEQERIVKFIDTKNKEIEEFIADKQEQIALLEEQKEAIINQAVTKGLDDSVKMKGSGIEWIGDIPEHWKVRKLKYCVSNKTIKSSDFSFKIALENIESKQSKFIKTEEIPFSEAGIIFKNGDILFGKLRPYLVKVFLVEQDGICVSEFLVLESLNNIIFNKFVKYLMLSSIFIDVVNGSTYGSKMPRASWDFIGDLKIVLPNIDEQKEIIKYIEAELSKIDKVIKQIQKEIDLIKEYKISLISEVVTGQIKVI
ncbi:MAG: restriction endonuclease subunit S, partial [Campylobacteraceae bacterium]|nr:restriction endonuclease subunit S [Campylobacteraceae bacterium]